MELSYELELIEKFKTLIRHGMIYAQRAHDYIFDDETEDIIALQYLNVAASKFSAAEALYYSRYEELQHDEAEELFHLFDVFMSEVLTNVRTKHSHQWSDIEFIRLKECFDYSPFAFENKYQKTPRG